MKMLRPCLSAGAVTLFAVYGVVYVLSILGIISPRQERLCYLVCTVGSKLVMAAVFVVIRSFEYLRTLSSMLQKVSSSNTSAWSRYCAGASTSSSRVA